MRFLIAYVTQALSHQASKGERKRDAHPQDTRTNSTTAKNQSVFFWRRILIMCVRFVRSCAAIAKCGVHFIC